MHEKDGFSVVKALYRTCCGITRPIGFTPLRPAMVKFIDFRLPPFLHGPFRKVSFRTSPGKDVAVEPGPLFSFTRLRFRLPRQIAIERPRRTYRGCAVGAEFYTVHTDVMVASRLSA